VLLLDENWRPGRRPTTVGKHRFRYEPWPIVGGPSLGSELARALGELGPASEVRPRSTLPHARGEGRFGEVNAQDRPKRSGMDTIRRLALCATLSLAGATAPAGAARPIEPALAARAAEPGGVPVLVALAVATQPEPRIPAPARAAQRACIAAMREALRGELGAAGHAVARAYRSIPFVALEVGPEALAALRRSPRVRAVHPDPLRRPSLDASVPIVQADQAIALGFDGAGAAVAVLDTGVDVLHPNLAGKRVAEACASRPAPPARRATARTAPGSTTRRGRAATAPGTATASTARTSPESPSAADPPIRA
jgi:subtilisin family serine protease